MASSQRNDPDTAAEIDRLAMALAKDPKSKAFMPLAEAYIKAGMWAEASVVLEDGLKVYPGFVTAMAALGRVYEQLNQPVKAKAILEEVVKQSPDNLRAHRILAKIFSSEGKADQALRSCAAILAVSPYDEEALSIKRGITGTPEDEDAPRSKRDKKRLKHEHKSESKPKPESPRAEPPAATRDAEPASEPVVVAPSGPVEQPVRKHAATIERLESWLRTIQARRQANPSSL